MPGIEIDDRKATAIHEVGHGLLAVLFGLELRRVMIYRAWFTSFGGEAVYNIDKLPPEIREEDIDMFCMISRGGQEAESIWISSTYGLPMDEAYSITHSGASSDRRNFNYMSQFTETPRSTLKNGSRKFLLSRWSQVEALAVKLEERRRLNDGTVRKQVNQRPIEPRVTAPQFKLLTS